MFSVLNTGLSSCARIARTILGLGPGWIDEGRGWVSGMRVESGLVAGSCFDLQDLRREFFYSKHTNFFCLGMIGWPSGRGKCDWRCKDTKLNIFEERELLTELNFTVDCECTKLGRGHLPFYALPKSQCNLS